MESGGSDTWSGSPRTAAGSASCFRNALRVQRSAPSGSSASEKRRDASRVLLTGAGLRRRYAKTAHDLFPRGGGTGAPSRRTTGLPRSLISMAARASSNRWGGVARGWSVGQTKRQTRILAAAYRGAPARVWSKNRSMWPVISSITSDSQMRCISLSSSISVAWGIPSLISLAASIGT